MSHDMLGRAERPTPEHPLGKAVCGTPITPGLIVWTNEMRTGVVVDDPERFARPYWDGWFEVLSEGRRVLQDQNRVITVFEGRRASDHHEKEGR